SFPRALGLLAAAALVALLAAGGGAVLLRKGGHSRGASARGPAWLQVVTRSLTLPSAWHHGRKGMAAAGSVVLSAVGVGTALFVTKPPIFLGPAHAGYDFSYTYHAPPAGHTGGEVVIGTGYPMHTLTSPLLNGYMPDQVYRVVWNGCVMQLPDLKLGLKGKGWQADQCTRVPTVANGDESVDGKMTTFHIDQRAVWS